ncbi:hypothetical protein A2326_02075 [candidate division WWE3 bacterium RIFOXYB2_FULL_41_6]|nr:MAG: hypothetical protein A2326_02075 [candidate division WWE3 bacterium RIFOXYB2_FULL_41_6]OGC71139.1 MAG: hypothetical protein A2602_01475 [candidate division WWE3 bacterium RIFOXYD1_FULL_40_11]
MFMKDKLVFTGIATPGAFNAGEDILGPDRVYHAVPGNKLQEQFVVVLPKWITHVSWLLSSKEVKFGRDQEFDTIVTFILEDAVEFLAHYGIESSIDSLPPDAFIMACVLALKFKWKFEGYSSETPSGYPAVTMTGGTNGYFLDSAHPIISVELDNGDQVVMCEADPVADELTLKSHSETLLKVLARERSYEVDAIFPKLEIKATQNQTWMKNLWTTVHKTGRKAWILEAYLHLILNMNHVGIEAVLGQEASMMLECASAKPTVIIDESFNLIYCRGGKMLFSVHIPKDHAYWADPGEIKF